MSKVEFLQSAMEQIFRQYSTVDLKPILIDAKKKFFERTGTLDEESADFEMKMNSFNEWFVFHYKLDQNTTVLDKYLENKQVDVPLQDSLKNVRYSVFEFKGKNFRKQDTIKDLLQTKKVVLAKDHPTVALMPGEYFSGRVYSIDNNSYLLKGLCIFPREVNSIIKKQAGYIRSNRVDLSEEEFLLRLEGMKNKTIHFNRLNPTEVFKF
jgi:hypothetical protein